MFVLINVDCGDINLFVNFFFFFYLRCVRCHFLDVANKVVQNTDFCPKIRILSIQNTVFSFQNLAALIQCYILMYLTLIMTFVFHNDLLLTYMYSILYMKLKVQSSMMWLSGCINNHSL